MGMTKGAMPEFKPRNTPRARTLRNTATPAERLLWQHLSRSQQGAKFSRQMPVGPFYADFLCRSLKLVIECDGISHDRTPEADARRDTWMRAEGYTVLRFTNADVLGNAEGVVATIRAEVERLQASQAHP
ncbi:endonuclease [Aurantiacibacter arachoides]|nr:endonuclease [Aurantiacibacter arachoides]